LRELLEGSATALSTRKNRDEVWSSTTAEADRGRLAFNERGRRVDDQSPLRHNRGDDRSESDSGSDGLHFDKSFFRKVNWWTAKKGWKGQKT